MVTATTPRSFRRLDRTTWVAMLYGAAVGFLLLGVIGVRSLLRRRRVA
jgi:hypothetical protein